jgi:hypothetical protein
VALADERRLADLATNGGQQVLVGQGTDGTGAAARVSAGIRGTASAALLARRRPRHAGDPAHPGHCGVESVFR